MLSAAEAKLAEQIRRADRLQDELNQARKDLEAEKNKAKTIKNAPLAIFFKINKANLTKKELINLEYYANLIKSNPGQVYKVIGYADKATGSAEFNQKLSEKRAQNVADALIKTYGVDAKQLEVIGKGGVANLYKGEVELNRVVIIE